MTNLSSVSQAVFNNLVNTITTDITSTAMQTSQNMDISFTGPSTQYITSTIPAGDWVYWDGTNTIPQLGTTWIGGGLPNTMPMPAFPYPTPVKPDLSLLEDGVYDIPGGKIIIKKIKISENQLEEAITETCGPEITPEEKAKIKEDLQDLLDTEERDV